MARGKVILIGAGAGDGELMSRRAARKLSEADVIVTDRLIDAKILVGIDPEKILYVGKGGGMRSVEQTEINALLIKLAGEGKIVARLKGGDPLIFGRGGEELESLTAAGIPFEIVPGITAASVAASYAGIPLTHRDLASTVCFVTGHEDPNKTRSAIDYAALAKMGTIVFYMSVSRLGENLSALMTAGLDGRTPAAIIEQAGSGLQRTIVATVSKLAETARRENVKAPALVIVGEVVSLREKLAWFETKPLFGKTVVLTRPSERMTELGSELSELGAQVLPVPTIELQAMPENETIDTAIRDIGEGKYDWLVLTSPKGVDVLADRLRAIKLDARTLSKVKIAVIGEATGNKLRDYLIEPDLQPKPFTSEALADALIEQKISGQKVLLLRAELADNQMAESLTAAGAKVTQVSAYRTRFVDSIEPVVLERLERSRSIDFVVFGSSSTVRSFFAMVDRYSLQDKVRQATMISIGPVTSRQLKDLGHTAIEADEQSTAGLLSAILKIG
jgi:uroporphyrinogen III methyltransferase/synthase